MSLLDDGTVDRFLADRSGWERRGREIVKTFVFTGFGEALGFVVQVGLAAEKDDHHPDIDIRWNKVTLALSTHSEGGLTQRDLELAGTLDRLVD